LIQSRHLEKLRQALIGSNYDVAVAHDGQRMHPVFLALKTQLATSLQLFLSEGQRKIDIWLHQQALVEVDFSGEPEVFYNINTVDELTHLENT
ncbi:MAG: molybdenum cofactor guanylyltransferase MobA, partial [Methylococcales bacterium]